MRQDLVLSNFTSGELSPRMKGRVDVAKYFNGCDTLKNFVVMPQGGATRRPGTMFVAMAQNQASASRLIDFQFSTIQAYQIEFSNALARFYMDDAIIVSGASPVTLAVPYTAAQIAQLEYTQSDDTLFLCHPTWPTQELTRSGNESWSINQMNFRDGPYLDENGTATTLSVSGASGSITVTASSIVGINATGSNTGQGFLATDVGRLIRIQLNAVWGWLQITAVHSATVVTATVMPTVANGAFGLLDEAAWPASTVVPAGWICLNGSNNYVVVTEGLTAASGGPTGTGTNITDGTAVWNYRGTAPNNATVAWQLGKWSATTGYPYAPTFWQNRLILAGTNNQPNAIEGSVTGDFTNFAPTQADGTVADINALSWIISDDQVNAVTWLSAAGSAQAMQLGIGTSGGEEIMQANTTVNALTPTNVQAYRETSLGSRPNVRPQRIVKSVLFANKPGRKVHEWTFQWTVNGYLGPDLAVLAEHITGGGNGGGIVQMAYQQSPHSVVWAIRADGTLISLTYLREQDVVAWTEHQLGGQYYGGPPIVESLSVIPAPSGAYDELWLAVLRTIDGVPTRTIEVMTAYFDLQPLEQAFFVDCGLSTALTYPAGTVTPAGFANTQTVTGQPPAFSGTGTVSLAGGSFTAGDVGQVLRMNGGVLAIQSYVSPSQVTALVMTPMTSLAPAASNTWSLNPLLTTITGLGYLAGETVALLGDGQVFTPQVASSSMAIAPPGASFVTAGLPYLPVMVGMPWEAARAAASAQGRIKRIFALYLRFYETAGGSFGLRTTDEMTGTVTDNLEAILSRSAWAPMSQAVPLYSGIRRVRPSGASDREGQIIVTQPDPLPITILLIGAVADVQELAVPGQ